MQTMRQMNSMMNSLFNDPFQNMMGQNALMPYGRGIHNDMPVSLFDPNFGRFGFNNMGSNGNCHSFMSQSVMTMSSGPDGRPQVYQETMSTRMAPGGIKETKQTVSDSLTGTRKMAIGHHIGERAHILERERNMHGEEEERQEFINLDEEEAESFNHEWETRTRRVAGSIDGPNSATAANIRHHPEPRQLALPSTTDQPASRHSNRRWVPSARRAIRSLNPLKIKSTSSSSSLKSPESAASARAEASSTSSSTSGSRKREHKPDRQISNKRHVPPSDN
ncbi:myeloid leukemia factor isoform X1 [Pogonomyrmex barbatus]|uniref:Myeloid leukemia factor isoform X1 n=1 Tax=Pogonomyrmex barbatus TaxID=144034 RepID=A0A6I9VU11_9HYME|nr:myeloid leukemia factor isoform X1 [Pogonomyrmex barbatus]